LIAENSELLLPTILSRTQLIKLSPILDEDLTDYFMKKDYDDVGDMVRFAQGDLIKALSYNSDEKKEYRELFIQFNRLAFNYNSSLNELYKLVEQISKMGREELKVYLNYSLELYRECFQQGELKIDNLCNFTEEEKGFKTNFSKFITPKNLLNIYNLTQKAEVEIMRNGNAKMIFLTLAINIGKLIRNTQNK
jgi:DNA polymerase-3 subunit delta'